MKKLTLTTTLLLLIIMCNAQYIIKGQVKDVTGSPLQSVTVELIKEKSTTLTDAAGNFTISSNDSITQVKFSHAGYEPEIVQIKNTESASIILFIKEGMLSELRVTAFEMNSKIKDAPVAVSILNQAALQRYSNTTFIPAINTIPGVKMDERSPGSYRLSIRGNLLRSTFGVRNAKIYWDGIPFTDANGNTYLNQVAFYNIGRIEVIKGPSGSMYGSGTGGVVLMNSPVNLQGEKYVQFQAAAGSYGMISLNGSYNVANSKTNSVLSISHQKSEGYRAHSAMNRDVAHYTGKFNVSPKQDLLLNIFYSDLFYKTPGGLNPAELAANPRAARPAAGAFRSAEEQKASINLKTLYAGIGSMLRFNSQWSNFTGLYISNTNFKNPTIRNVERKTEQGTGIRSLLKYRQNKFAATIGGEFQYTFNNISVFGNKMGVTDTLQYHDEIDSRQFNFFLQTDYTLGKTLLTAGISYNNYNYGFIRLSQTGSPKSSSTFTPQFIPRLALTHEISDKINAYASVSKGYSPPSIDEVRAGNQVFNSDLKAETGLNYEVGIKTNPVKNKLWADVSYYLFGLQNTIVSRRDASGADFFINAGKTKQLGLEVAVNYIAVNNQTDFVRLLKLWSSYTNINAKFTEYQQGTAKYDGNKLTGTPPNVVVAGIDVSMKKGLTGNFSYTYTDAIPLNDANTFYASHYNLVYGRISMLTNTEKKIVAEIFVAGEYSFNNPYSLGNDLNAAGNRFYNPTAPQMFTIGSRIRFNLNKSK